MKAVILAGGLGTRISEESILRPKPMVEIGGKPILWHIMKIFSAQGFNDFIICAGYRQHMIKEYFADYFLHTSDVTFDFSGGTREVEVHTTAIEPWRVTIVDTGLNTMTGGRIKRIAKYVDNEPFMITYGDGVGDIDLRALNDFHRQSGKMATLTAYNVGQRFGVVDLDSDNAVLRFREKAPGDGNLINIGFMVVEPEFIDLIDGDETFLEREPLHRAVDLHELSAYRHTGFWACMDTLREKERLQELWDSGKAPWKLWD